MGILAISAAASAAFNLVCSGYYHEWNDTKKEGPKAAYSITYRVSPDTMEWCDDVCSYVRPIYMISRDELAFAYQRRARMDNDTDVQIANRISGTHYALKSDPERAGNPYLKQWDGGCQRQPFSGFPGKQKF